MSKLKIKIFIMNISKKNVCLNRIKDFFKKLFYVKADRTFLEKCHS